MIDVFGDAFSLIENIADILLGPVICAVAVYSLRYEYSDKLAIDMALDRYPSMRLNELGWVPLTETFEAPGQRTGKSGRKLARLRILIWGLPKLQGLQGPSISAARRYRMNTWAAIVAGLLAAVQLSLWISMFLIMLLMVSFLRTSNWPKPKDLNA